MAEHNEIGSIGENIACNFLAKSGYEILERNYRFKKLEVDIICQKDDLLVVVEVKTRTYDGVLEPEMAVTKTKQKQIIKATNQYIIENEIDLETRFDIIGIVLQGSNQELRHIEDAFYPLL